MIKNILCIFLILCIKSAFTQEFKKNSIGVVYYISEDLKQYNLEIVFPIQCLDDFIFGEADPITNKTLGEFTSTEPILLFDDKGIFDTIKYPDKWKINFWCENDGGIQYRPVLELKIEKNRLSKILMAHPEIQNICCFASTNFQPDTKFKSIDDLKDKDIRLTGRFDGNNWSAIWVKPDNAMNCDTEPDNNLMIFLYSDGINYRLRCCGP